MTGEQKPLNILEVGSCFPGWGGTELHLLNLSEQLVRRGHLVTITARPGRYLEEQAKARGLRTVPVTVVKQQDWRNRNILRRLLRDEKFDVVHVHWRTDYVVTPLLARFAGVPAVLLSHHSPRPLKTREVVIYPRFLYSRMIALSESVRRMLVGQGFPAEFVTTIHHGTDTNAFRQTTLPPADVRAAWGIPENAFVAGMVGRIAPEKGWETFLEALAQVAGVWGVFVGEGPDIEDAHEKAAALKLTDRLVFAGFRTDVNNAVNALDTLVLASIWEEPCAAVVQQAMALGKPVIGTSTGGTPEMIADGQTGVIVSPGDASALAGALRHITAQTPEERAQMGASGRARVEALFTLEHMTDRNEALYYEVCAAASQRKRRGKHDESSQISSAG